MGIFNNTKPVKATVGKESFIDRLNRTKSMFKTAFDSASTLNTEMEAEMDKKNGQIKLISAEIEQIKTVQDDTKQFMSNLEKFI